MKLRIKRHILSWLFVVCSIAAIFCIDNWGVLHADKKQGEQASVEMVNPKKSRVEESKRYSKWYILIVFWVLIVWHLGRLWVYYKYKKQSEGIFRATDKCNCATNQLLPSQQSVLSSVISKLSDFDVNAPAIMCAIEGEWGSGKSFLVQRLVRVLNEQDQVAAILINVWSHQDEVNLHAAIVDEILSHPKILDCCFKAYSVKILLVKLMLFLHDVFPGGFGVSGLKAKINLRFRASKKVKTDYQDVLRSVISCTRGEGLRVVVILDEVDRAASNIAQEAMMLTRRAFHLPGLAVVLPYVPEQIRQKVFNPLINHIPELNEAMIVQLERVLPGNMARSYTVEREAFEKAKNFAEERLFECLSCESEQGEKERRGLNGALVLENMPSLVWQLKKYVLMEAYYCRLDSRLRKRIQDAASEKYLSFKVPMPPIRYDDIPVILGFSTVESSTPNELRFDFLDKDKFGLAVTMGAFANLGGDADMPPPMIRHFEGKLIETLENVGQWSGLQELKDERMKESIMLAICVIAWRSAQHIGVLIGGNHRENEMEI